jgi:hypothetical protein
MPPDVTAAIFWLKNRDPARWRDAWQMEHTLGKHVISDRPMTEEEWIRECARLRAAPPRRRGHLRLHDAARRAVERAVGTEEGALW